MNPFVQQLLNAARNTAARAAKGFVVQADRNAGPQVRRALGSGYLNRYSNPIVSATKKDPSLINAAVKGSLSVPGAKPILAMPVGLLALDPRLPGAIEGGLNQVGPGLDRFFGAVTPKPVQDFGRSMEQYGWGALGGFVPGERTAAYGGPNAAYYGPAYASAEALGLGTPGSSLRDYGPGYKERELAAGAAAEQFRPGAGFPGQQGAADRAYQQEKARVTQMTEQDPMFKKYKVAELTKAYNTASPEEKNKIGLQIWATTNPELAAKLKPGQTGYQEAYDLLGTQTFGTGQPVSTKVNFEQSTEKAGAPTPELPTGFAQAYTNPVPNFGMGINMQQTAYAPEGQSAPEMVSPDFSNVPLMSPPKELVDLMKNRAFKQAFESRIK
jgi:hypothetical protein